MIKSSCADCGRIIAFRTPDPSEIAECRSCGTWVKRSEEQPGVAIAVQKNGRTASSPVSVHTEVQKATEPVVEPSFVKTPDPTTEPIQHSATVYYPVETTASPTAPMEQTTVTESSFPTPQPTAPSPTPPTPPSPPSPSQPDPTEKLSPSAVYSALRQIEQSLRELKEGQRFLHEGQRRLEHGQEILFERTLPLTEMPSPSGVSPMVVPEPETAEDIFTTPFSSLQIPVIPTSLSDLEIETQLSESHQEYAIPAEDRSNIQGLLEGPLPEPPPELEPEPIQEPAQLEPTESCEQQATPSFTRTSSGKVQLPGMSEKVQLPDFSHLSAPEPSENQDSFDYEGSSTGLPNGEPQISEQAFETPSLEATGPFPHQASDLEDPSFVSEITSTEAEQEQPSEDAEENTGFTSLPAFSELTARSSAKNQIEVDPFANELEAADFESDVYEDQEDTESAEDKAEPFTAAPSSFTLNDINKGSEDSPNAGANEKVSLSAQIAAAKAEHSSGRVEEHQGQQDETSTASRSPLSSLLRILLLLLILGALVAAALFFLPKLLKKTEEEDPKVSNTTAELITFPNTSKLVPNGDPRKKQARQVADAFLKAQTEKAVLDTILPLPPNSDLLENFWEPFQAATIETIYPGRYLADDHIEFDILIRDLGRESQLLPVIMKGESDFKVDWLTFANCEDVPLQAFVQGALTLKDGQKVPQVVNVRGWVKSSEGMKETSDLGNLIGYRVQSTSGDVMALGTVQPQSPAHESLQSALESTEILHKGQPAVRAVLRVLLSEKAGTSQINPKPARIKIKEVLQVDIALDSLSLTNPANRSLANPKKPRRLSPNFRRPSNPPKQEDADPKADDEPKASDDAPSGETPLFPGLEE